MGTMAQSCPHKLLTRCIHILRKLICGDQFLTKHNNYKRQHTLPVFVSLIHNPDLVPYFLPSQEAVNMRCKL